MIRWTLCLGALVACSGEPGTSTKTAAPVQPTAARKAADPDGASLVNPRLLRRFQPLRATMSATPLDERQVALGRQLFFDRRLSRDRDLSCNSCHTLDRYGVDGDKTSKGANGKRGRRNSPTVFHAAGQFVQMWDGRSPDVEAQATMPILEETEMAMASPDTLLARLREVPGYVRSFADAFPGTTTITIDQVGRALAAFERGLATPSRWDRFLTGDQQALSAREIEGFKTFTDLGCMSCHTGELLGGSMYQRAGLVEPWPNQQDLGRYEVTKLESDRMMFKVPSLRNVTKTAPYFHDGAAATLEEAVRMMGHHQLGVDLTNDEITSIIAWLASLTGDLPAAYIKEPALPAEKS
jgi:cytochrome c peroxidase